LIEIVCGRKNPSVTITRVVLELTNEIWSPLLEGCLHNNWFHKEVREALLSNKELARMKGSDVAMSVRENNRPIISFPQNFMSNSVGQKMASKISRMKLYN